MFNCTPIVITTISCRTCNFSTEDGLGKPNHVLFFTRIFS